MIKAGNVVAALSVSLFSIPAHAQCTFPFDRQIFGEYRGDDGGTYHMRQIGEDVWWVGLSGDDGKSFTNVFHGQIHGNQLTGGWLDVPFGNVQNPTHAGQVTIKIINTQVPDTLVKENSPTGPAVSHWTRIHSCPDTN
jgi:hypothetical protein